LLVEGVLFLDDDIFNVLIFLSNPFPNYLGQTSIFITLSFHRFILSQGTRLTCILGDT